MVFLTKLKWQIKALLESHPLGYYLGNKLLSLSSLFLPHEEDFFGFKKLPVGENGLFLDVGANDGKSARSFRKLFKKWHVLSIEANPLHSPTLQKLKKTMKNFDFKIGAIGQPDQELILYTPIYKKIAIHSAASVGLQQVQWQMKKQFKRSSILDKIYFQQTKTQPIHLDSLNLAPDIIKIDIEGMDHIALVQLAKTIQKNLPIILVEYNPIHFAEIKNFLLPQGYAVYGFDINKNQFLEFNESYRNCFFIPDPVYKQLIDKQEIERLDL